MTLDSFNQHLARCRVDVARGQLGHAAARLQEIQALAHQPNLEVACILSRIDAEIALWRDEPGAAAAVLKPLIPRLIGSDEERLGDEQLAMAMRACADLAAAAEARQDRTAAAAAAALRQELVGMLARMRTDPFAEHPFLVTGAAHGADWRAELARSEQLDDGAHWDAAAHAWQKRRRAHRAGYARWRQAEALLRHGQRPEAAAALTTAWGLAQQHQPLRTEITNPARIARIDLSQPAGPGAAPQPEASPQPDPYKLTARGMDVLRLLVDGLTNPQIGAQLYMSPKTASVHVTAILRKLNAANRVQAAAIALRAGIVEADR